MLLAANRSPTSMSSGILPPFRPLPTSRRTAVASPAARPPSSTSTARSTPTTSQFVEWVSWLAVAELRASHGPQRPGSLAHHLAVHESGHALVAVLLGRRFESVEIGSAGGLTLLGSNAPDPTVPVECQQACTLAAAGPVAELLTFGNRTAGIKNDDTSDAGLLAKMAARFANRFPTLRLRNPFEAAQQLLSPPAARAALDRGARALAVRHLLTCDQFIQITGVRS